MCAYVKICTIEEEEEESVKDEAKQAPVRWKGKQNEEAFKGDEDEATTSRPGRASGQATEVGIGGERLGGGKREEEKC